MCVGGGGMGTGRGSLSYMIVEGENEMLSCVMGL